MLRLVRAAYLAMALIVRFVIVPLSLAAPLTGLVMALGTRWGLFRHYWILIKLLTTIFATAALLIHVQPINFMADAAAGMRVLGADLGGARIQLLAASGLAVPVLLTIITLAVFKPRGMTKYGRRKQHEQRS